MYYPAAAATLVLLLLTGCGQLVNEARIGSAAAPERRNDTSAFVAITAAPASDTPEDSPASSADQENTDDSDRNSPADANVVSAAETVALPGTEGPTAGDPRGEGWETEAVSEQASAQLSELGHLLERTGGPSADALSAVLDERFESPVLLPSSLKRVFRDETTEVLRWSDGASPAPMPSLSDRRRIFGPLVDAFANVPERKSKFKLFRVELDGGEIVTLQYFHLSGRSPTQAREHNALWRVGWSTGHADRLPRIRWIKLEQVEQVTTRVSPAKAWLVDSTESLLGDAPTAATSLGLRTGIDQWLTQLEGPLGVYNFGHHGVTVGDVNGDRLDDLYVCQTGGVPNHLYVQAADGTLRDISAWSGTDYLDNTRSALMVDLDNDGDQDLVLALATGLVFLENDGQGRFRARARISSVRQAFSLAAADYDQDTRLDIYVCVYYGRTDDVSELPLPLPYFNATNGGENYLIRNLGNWRFEDATDAAGLSTDNRRYSFAAAWEDHDNDGDLDLLVVNDYGPNQLFVNDRGRFRNVAETSGLHDGAFGMSAAWGDYDRDGDMDIYVANMFSAAGNRVTHQRRFKPSESDHTIARFRHLARGNTLFRNQGKGEYDDVSVEMGVTMGRWSWGSLFIDLNNDRWEDLLVTNGFITGTQTDDL